MSLGSRISNRGRAAVNASLALTPREPLLFLYPRGCLRYSTAIANEPKTRQNGPQAKIDEGGRSTATISQDQLDLLIKGPSLENKDGKEEFQPRPAQSIRNDTKTTTSHASPNSATVRKAPIARLRREDPSAYLKLKANRWLTWRDNRQAAVERQHDGRKQYQEAARVRRGADLPDWRKILATLIENTPETGKWLNKAVMITVPENSRQRILKSVDDNIYDIAVTRHGCSLQYLNPQVQEGELKFLLSGSTSGIKKTVRDIMQIAVEVNFHRTSESEITLYLKAINDTVLTLEGPQEQIAGEVPRKASEIPRPNEWTISSFNDYVNCLTSAPMPNHVHRLLYGDQEDHVSTVVSILLKIFSDPRAAKSVSRTAFNTAMQYLIKTNRIFDARCLFVRMDINNLRMDTETFNIMLRGAAKARDLSNFQTILALMLKRGHTPNARTFVAFMMAFVDVRIKSYVMVAMDQKGLLNHKKTLKGACEHIVGDLIESSLERNQTDTKFLEEMDNRYGSDWLSVDSGNRIIHAIGNRWLISRCWEFVLEMKARSVDPDEVTLNTILHKCKDMKNIQGAVELIKAWQTIGPLPMDELSYQSLFDSAWQLRMYNTARVVWRYACLGGLTTAKMRTTVFNSLKVGLGLDFKPGRGLQVRDRASQVVPPPRLQATSDYQSLLLAVEQAGDVPAQQESSGDEHAVTENPAENIGPTDKESLSASLTTTHTSPPSELNRFGHVQNPNNVIKMFHRTAGLFICGIEDLSSHPAQEVASGAEDSTSIIFESADKYPIAADDPVRQVSSIAEVMSEPLSTVHLANHKSAQRNKSKNMQKRWIALRQMDLENSMFKHWKPRVDFAMALAEAYEKDMEWRNPDVYEDAKSLEWMLARAVKVPIQTRPGTTPTVWRSW
ncbi:hypothetical protein BP6252_12278 [Coleophoma cylindrospora]|uniref:Pentatricopeptide repeat protein n=1 Tax=Coleophoma cylindrospora TaxID=1849047 RepID=A0A3D8QGG2_9HELO|nr:hypothetical protein BP6252_12278 [Coleophoma cylindrospora]